MIPARKLNLVQCRCDLSMIADAQLDKNHQPYYSAIRRCNTRRKQKAQSPQTHARRTYRTPTGVRTGKGPESRAQGGSAAQGRETAAGTRSRRPGLVMPQLRQKTKPARKAKTNVKKPPKQRIRITPEERTQRKGTPPASKGVGPLPDLPKPRHAGADPVPGLHLQHWIPGTTCYCAAARSRLSTSNRSRISCSPKSTGQP